MKKPDRFEREATQAACKLTLDKEHPDGGELRAAVVAALRKEHRWMERMVRVLSKNAEEHIFQSGVDGYELACLDILHRLKQRRK